jgi:glycine cleavage system H protein
MHDWMELMSQEPEIIRYRRARFTTRLPVDRLYTRSHYWLLEEEPGVWRVGFTEFAIRMLGDFVELGWEHEAGRPVAVGDHIGWVEGFKAVSELYAVAAGEFLGGNPVVDQGPEVVDAQPYREGWLYWVRGQAEPESLDVHGYISFLDETIDRMKGQYGE